MQLEGAQLDAQDVVARIDGGMRKRLADVADRRGFLTARLEHRRNHLRGGRLAVGAGDADPWRLHARALVRGPQPPGQLHFAVNGHAVLLGLDEEWRARVEARRSDHDVDLIPVYIVEGAQIGLRLALIHRQDASGPALQHVEGAAPGNA